MAGLLKEHFDEAQFLFDLYKGSSAAEVQNFKYTLDHAQSEIIG